MAISAILLIVSLFVVIHISDRLTRPISSFARTLAEKEPEDLSPVPLPPGTRTSELVEMVDTFNRYQDRIHSLVERERSFSRYASHELRTPLTVMKGALTLMDESDDPKFTALQRQRLKDAVREMSELIETLLYLTRSAQASEIVTRTLTKEEIQDIVSEHEHLLAGKDLSWRIDVSGRPEVRMPHEPFRILLGNLVSNSFTYAQSGEVAIEVHPGGLSISDAHSQQSGEYHGREGFGLGLLLVRDICHRFGWQSNHEDNEQGGWTTHVTFND